MFNRKITVFGTIIPLATMLVFLAGCSSSSSPSSAQDSSSSSTVINNDDDDTTSNTAKSSASSTNDKNNNANNGDSESNSDTPPEDNIVATLCKATKLSSTDKTLLDQAGGYIIDLLDAYTSKNRDYAKTYGNMAYTLYSKLLEANPTNCDIQLGYAVTSVINLANNGVLNELLSISDDEIDRIRHLSAGQMFSRLESIVKNGTGSNSSLTAQTQKDISESILPTINTAIKYLNNIIAATDYTYTVSTDDDIRQLDMSEFGEYLGYLYFAKAACTAIASLELELRQDGSYEWIDDVNHVSSSKMTSAQVEAVETALATVGVNSVFAKVKSKWITEWKSVPNYLDSAIAYMKKGYEFSLTDTDQDYDVYVVGNGYDADLSIADVKEMITKLDTKKKELHGTYSYEYATGKTILVSVAKLFSITNGVADYLPYYEYDGSSDLSTFKFTDANGKVLATLADFKNHKYSAKNAESLIIFPDPTFGGVFPYATNADIWDLLIETKTIKF